MPFKEIELSKKKALSFYEGSDAERAKALAKDLGIDFQVIQHWKRYVPRWWSIIIVNLIHRDKFGLPPIGE